MKTITTKTKLRETLDAARNSGKQIGFVPTMGALHAGHIALVEGARKHNDIVVVSIFVNPTQFNDPSDLKNYPRTPEADAKMLEAAHCDILFLPEVAEMYPDSEAETSPVVQLNGLDEVMEGRFRPGHFNGVVNIVSRLFNAVGECRAYFGEKDFQQLAVVRKMAQVLLLPVEIVGCPIVRESDGLAMSSRNVRLTPEERSVASFIYTTLQKAKQLWTGNNSDDVKVWVTEAFAAKMEFKLDYFEIADRDTLQPAKQRRAVACIAVFLGKVRLIDNVLLD